MVCIYCGKDTEVTNSRLQKKSNQIWRRRKCLTCGSVFTTEETVATGGTLLFRNAKGGIEPFQRDKLFLSVLDSLRHRKTAVSDATALTATIWSRLLPLVQEAGLERDQTVIIAHDVLKKFDKAAASAYQAYHPLRPEFRD